MDGDERGYTRIHSLNSGVTRAAFMCAGNCNEIYRIFDLIDHHGLESECHLEVEACTRRHLLLVAADMTLVQNRKLTHLSRSHTPSRETVLAHPAVRSKFAGTNLDNN